MPEKVLPVQSCPLCYQAEETSSMVQVDIDQPSLKHVAHIRICRWCATAIAKALKATGELSIMDNPALEEPAAQ
jgi:hypothetical protein